MTESVGTSGLRVDGAVVARSALWSALATVVSVPLLAVSTLVIARTLGPVGVGRIALDTFVVSLASVLIDLGITTALLRRGMLAAGMDDTAEVVAQAQAANTWSVAQVPFAIGIGALVLPRPDALALYAIGVISARLFIGPSHLAVATSRLAVASQVQLATTVLGVASTITVALVTHRADLTFAVGYLAGNVLTVAKVVGVPRGLRRASLSLGRIRLARGDLTYALSSVLNSNVATLVFSQSEVAFFGHAQAVSRGRYSVAQTIAGRSTLVLDALLGPLSAGMTSAYGRGDAALRKSFGLAAVTINLLLILACPAGFAVVALFAQPLFGHGFAGVTGPALVLTVASLFQSAAAPILGLCWARRQVRPMLVSGLAGSAVDLALAFVLVHRFGVEGALVACVLGQAVYFVFLLAQVQGRDERAMSMRHTWQVLLLLAATVLPGLALTLLPLWLASLLLLPSSVLVTAVLARAWGSARGRFDVAIGMLPGFVQRVVGSRPVALVLGLRRGQQEASVS